MIKMEKSHVPSSFFPCPHFIYGLSMEKQKETVVFFFCFSCFYYWLAPATLDGIGLFFFFLLMIHSLDGLFISKLSKSLISYLADQKFS